MTTRRSPSDTNTHVVKCPLCPETRTVSGRAFRSSAAPVDQRPCNRHSHIGRRCKRITGKYLYAEYPAFEKEFLTRLIKEKGVGQTAEAMKTTRRNLDYLLIHYRIETPKRKFSDA